MKKTKVKSILALFLSVTMLGNIGAAANAKGTEWNDKEIPAGRISETEVVTNAVKLNVNQQRDNDKLATDIAENWYQFTISSNGYFQVYLGYNPATDADGIGDGWDVNIYKKGDIQNPVKTYERVKSSVTSAYLPFEAGTYYIKVTNANERNSAYAATLSGYDIKVKYVPTAYWESEYNDKNTAADSIRVNTTYSGTLYRYTDVDWYRFSTPTDGYFKLQWTINDLTDVENINDGWNVDIYDSNYKCIKKYEKIRSSVTEQELPFAKGTYYIKVYAYFSHTAYSPTDAIYDLKIQHTSAKTWEKEGNDKSAKAENIALNKTYKGNLYQYNDVDWYKIKVSKKGAVKFTLAKDAAANIEDINSGWRFKVYDATANKMLAEVPRIKSSASKTLTLNPGTYLVLVKAEYDNAAGAPIDCTYNFSTGYTKAPGKAAITRVTAGKKYATVKWKKVTGASGYYVYRSTSKNGKYTKIATIKKGSILSYKNTKLKSKKNYYYKVAAYTTTKGVTAEGSMSAVKAVKVK